MPNWTGASTPCAALGEELGRRLSADEQYYSVHGPGAYLGLHMDERHESFKAEGRRDVRRSVSWLVYLNEKPRGGEPVHTRAPPALVEMTRAIAGGLVGGGTRVPGRHVRGTDDEALYGLYAPRRPRRYVSNRLAPTRQPGARRAATARTWTPTRSIGRWGAVDAGWSAH